MTRSELIARLAAHSHFAQLTAKDAELSVKAILEALSGALVRGDRIGIRGFGSFALNQRPPRSGRNPKTGVVVEVPAKRVPHFTPGKNYERGWIPASLMGVNDTGSRKVILASAQHAGMPVRPERTIRDRPRFPEPRQKS